MRYYVHYFGVLALCVIAIFAWIVALGLAGLIIGEVISIVLLVWASGLARR